MGFSKQFCNTKIYLKQQEFFSGEKIPIHLVCTNQCDKPIKNFKFKLLRRYRGRGKRYKFDEYKIYVAKVKEEGLKPGSKCEKFIDFLIPDEALSTLYNEM